MGPQPRVRSNTLTELYCTVLYCNAGLPFLLSVLLVRQSFQNKDRTVVHLRLTYSHIHQPHITSPHVLFSFLISCVFICWFPRTHQRTTFRRYQNRLEEDKTIGANGFKNLKLIPDGACQFTRGMGMSTIWSSERGFGERSWRYSCVINDMKVEKIFLEHDIEQNVAADPFDFSDVGTMLKYLKSAK